MKKIVVACILAFAAPLAQANFISFMDIADGDTTTSDGSILTGAAGEAGWQPFEWDFGDGLILTVRGFETNGVTAPDPTSDTESYAYLDKGGAGMGVCTELNNSTSKQCDPSSDDNVSFGEYLALSFNKAVTIDTLVLNNNHDGGFNGSNVTINGIDTSVADGKGARSISEGWDLAAGEVFTLAYSNLGSEPPEDLTDIRTNHFYLESANISVPEPSTIALFGFGLVSFGFTARRNRKQG
jgi:hypothetical protein